MKDVQGSLATHPLALRRAGIRGVRLPFIFYDKDSATISCPVVGYFSLGVSVVAQEKGVHMSRFLQVLNPLLPDFSEDKFAQFTQDLLGPLEATEASLQVSFPFFIEVKAPVTKNIGLLDVDVRLMFSAHKDHGVQQRQISVCVPVKSLCPCSKAISEDGAHSQRGHITLTLNGETLPIHTLVAIAESAASSPLYPILKREDEKFVTEKAYATPRFVEDMAREAAWALVHDHQHRDFTVEVENFESIHNHNAWAFFTSADMPKDLPA